MSFIPFSQCSSRKKVLEWKMYHKWSVYENGILKIERKKYDNIFVCVFSCSSSHRVKVFCHNFSVDNNINSVVSCNHRKIWSKDEKKTELDRKKKIVLSYAAHSFLSTTYSLLCVMCVLYGVYSFFPLLWYRMCVCESVRIVISGTIFFSCYSVFTATASANK